MVKFIVPSSDEDSEDEILDEGKRSDNEERDHDDMAKDEEGERGGRARERHEESEEEHEEEDRDTSLQESNNNAKLQLMNYTLFPQESSRLGFEDEDDFDSDHDYDSTMRAPFGLVPSSSSSAYATNFPSSPTTALTTTQPMEKSNEPMYVLEPEPSAVLPRRYEYQPRGFDLAITASSITERTRTCSFPFRVGWGPRGQFVHTTGRTVIAINKVEIRPPPNSQTTTTITTMAISDTETARKQIVSRLNAHFHTPSPPRDRAPVAGEVCQGCWKPVSLLQSFSSPLYHCSLCSVIAHAECLSLVQSERKEQQQNIFGYSSNSESKNNNSFICSHHSCKKCEEAKQQRQRQQQQQQQGGEEEEEMFSLLTCEMCPNAYCEKHIPSFAIRKEEEEEGGGEERDNNRQKILCSIECDEKAKNLKFRLINNHLSSLCNKYDNETQISHPSLGGKNLSLDRSVWELVKRLWCKEFGGRTGGGNYEDIYARRTALSRWLEDTIRQEINSGKNNNSSNSSKNGGDSAEKILYLLLSHNIQQACQEAFETKNFRLGTLIAQIGEGGGTVREDIKKQTDSWKKNGAWALLSENYQNIYLLLAGGVYEDGLKLWAKHFNQQRLSSWLQAFGLQLWFSESPQNVSIEHALGQYEEAVKEETSPAPLPSHHNSHLRTEKKSRSSTESLLVEDVRMGLLKYYRDSRKFLFSKQLLAEQHNNLGQSSLSSLLRPEAWGRDPLDGALAWHLHDLLQYTPAYSVDEFPRLDHLYLNFIWQLEALGEWEWAIYVALHSPAGGNSWVANEELAKEILMRNVSPSSDFSSLPDVNVSQDLFVTLLEVLETSSSTALGLRNGNNPQALPHLAGCKSSWWHEALAVRARYDRTPSLEFAHLLACVDNADRSESHLAQTSLERAARVAATQLRPLYLLTDRQSERKLVSELDARLAPYQHLLPDISSQTYLNEPEVQVPASEPKFTSARTIHKLTLERPVPLSNEVLGELVRFEANFEF